MRTKKYLCYVSPGASPQAACSAGAHSGARRLPHQLREPEEEEDDNENNISVILINNEEEEDDNDDDKLPSLRSCLISIWTSIRWKSFGSSGLFFFRALRPNICSSSYIVSVVASCDRHLLRPEHEVLKIFPVWYELQNDKNICSVSLQKKPPPQVEHHLHCHRCYSVASLGLRQICWFADQSSAFRLIFSHLEVTQDHVLYKNVKRWRPVCMWSCTLPSPPPPPPPRTLACSWWLSLARWSVMAIMVILMNFLHFAHWRGPGDWWDFHEYWMILVARAGWSLMVSSLVFTVILMVLILNPHWR